LRQKRDNGLQCAANPAQSLGRVGDLTRVQFLFNGALKTTSSFSGSYAFVPNGIRSAKAMNWRCFLSYKASQLSPQSTNAESLRVVVQSSPKESPDGRHDMHFWRSWLELDSEGAEKRSSKLNWSALLGLTVVVGVSAGFWAGVGLLIARVLR
jgi:hypothetical protein